VIGCLYCTRTRRCRQGFTLTEVMLTLCLLVVIAAMAWPVLDRPFANQRLRKAADGIRAEWALARVEAMDSGRTYVFRYTPDGNQFRVECYATAATADEPIFDDGFGDSADGLGYADASRPPQEGTLPDRVTFVASETAPDTRAVMIESQAALPTAAESGWSEPILFYPDGTSSTARLLLKNDYDCYIELALRGLTGTVDVGEVQKAQER
jgi:prepilin-type N-terminal cleavage/methylation domain-containing protein